MVTIPFDLNLSVELFITIVGISLASAAVLVKKISTKVVEKVNTQNEEFQKQTTDKLQELEKSTIDKIQQLENLQISSKGEMKALEKTIESSLEQITTIYTTVNTQLLEHSKQFLETVKDYYEFKGKLDAKVTDFLGKSPKE